MHFRFIVSIIDYETYVLKKQNKKTIAIKKSILYAHYIDNTFIRRKQWTEEIL